MKRQMLFHGCLAHIFTSKRTTNRLRDNDYRSMGHYVACQTCTVLSLLAEAIRVPSGDHATEVVHAACSSWVWRQMPLAASHTCTVVSLLAVARRLPSGDQAISRTPS